MCMTKKENLHDERKHPKDQIYIDLAETTNLDIAYLDLILSDQPCNGKTVGMWSRIPQVSFPKME